MVRGRRQSVVGLDRGSFHAWAQALLWFGIGDLATSIVGIQTSLARESVPFVATLIGEYGLVAVIPVKVLGFAIAITGWKLTPEPYAIAIPISLAIVGLSLTGWNAYVILSGLGIV